ncbi:putative NADP-dependent oxidoreductase YfmJ [Diplonema papillatum]|nr:putative NADP-dependent oxidoreductase YfmJ [Diplonema papillatum]|eukprot:gene4186-6494_t
MPSNQEWQMVKYPEGMLTKECMKCADVSDPKEGDLKDGEVMLELEVISVDPYLRGLMSPKETYAPNYKLNEAMSGFVAGKVVASKSSKYKVGAFVTGSLPFRRRLVAKDSQLFPAFPSEKVKLSNFVGAAGMPGITAFISLKTIAAPKEGDYAFVSGGAGAVGSAVIQLLKAQGVKVIASAGTDDKVQMCKDLGATAAFNYKKVGTGPELEKTLTDFAPKGLNIYFDNVGGRTLDAALACMAGHGRVVACGAISQYNNKDASEAYGLKNSVMIVLKTLKVQGFMVFDHLDQYVSAGKELTQMVADGKLVAKETVLNGFEKVPDALIGLFTGENTGKMVVTLQ